jgi:hypothetical protein
MVLDSTTNDVSQAKTNRFNTIHMAMGALYCSAVFLTMIIHAAMLEATAAMIPSSSMKKGTIDVPTTDISVSCMAAFSNILIA